MKNEKKNKRIINVPISMCADMRDMPKNSKIIYVGFYDTVIEGKTYIIDIIQTNNMNCYVSLTDITDDMYNEIDFEEFKRRHEKQLEFNFLNV